MNQGNVVRTTKQPGERPELITNAPASPRAEFDYRRKRYAITMGIRIVCLIVAALSYRIIWLWPIFAVAAILLPWFAVVLANDRLPTNPSRFQRYLGVGRGGSGVGSARSGPALPGGSAETDEDDYPDRP